MRRFYSKESKRKIDVFKLRRFDEPNLIEKLTASIESGSWIVIRLSNECDLKLLNEFDMQVSKIANYNVSKNFKLFIVVDSVLELTIEQSLYRQCLKIRMDIPKSIKYDFKLNIPRFEKIIKNKDLQNNNAIRKDGFSYLLLMLMLKCRSKYSNIVSPQINKTVIEVKFL